MRSSTEMSTPIRSLVLIDLLRDRKAEDSDPEPPAPEEPTISVEEHKARLEEARRETADLVRREERERFEAQLEEALAGARAEHEIELARERERIESAVGALQDAAKKLEASAVPWLDTLQTNLCALAVAVARQIIGELAERDSRIVRAIVQDALSQFGSAVQPLRVHLHPADLDVVRETTPDWEVRGMELVADPHVSRGGCVIEGPESLVDGDIESNLAMIYRKLVHG